MIQRSGNLCGPRQPGRIRCLKIAFVLAVCGGITWPATAAGRPPWHPPVIARGSTDPAYTALADRECPERWSAAPLITLFDSTRVVVEPSGLTHRHHHRLTRVVSEAGGLALAALRFDYDPASNTVVVCRVRIHHADGSFEELDPAAAADVFAPASSIYWGARMKVVGLPRLRPGDLVETVTYTKGFLIAYLLDIDSPRGDTPSAPGGDDEEKYIPPMRGHFYDTVLFGDSRPFFVKHYEVTLPRNKPLHTAVYNQEVYSSQSFSDSTMTYRWWALTQDAVVAEVRQTSRNDFVAKVVMATVPDWPEKSRWFFEVNDPVFAWSQPIQEKVEALTEGLDTDEERWAALTHWVADNIRYSGLSMGVGEGYTIHPSLMTWEDRCGVCKDIAGMLVTFLRAAGYVSYPAMTMAGARVESVPADQFNHCVVAVEQADGSYVMLDPTWVGHSRDVWSKAEGEQHYVIGSPQGEDLCRIRSFTAEESPLAVRLESRIEDNGDLRGTLEMEGRGYSDGRLRRQFLSSPPSRRDHRLAGYLQAIAPGVDILDSEYGDIRDYAAPMRVKATFVVPGYAAVTDSSIDFPAPSLRLLAGSGDYVRLLGAAADEDRDHPANFWAPTQVDITAKLKLPRTYTFGDLPACRLEFPVAAYSCDARRSGRHLEWTHQLALRERTVSPAEWNDVAAVGDTVTALADRWISGRKDK